MQRIHRILLVDDNLEDRLLSSHVLREILPAGSSLQQLGSGQEAIAYCIGEGVFANRSQYPFPTLVICDLNMPQCDGFAVLEFLQANPAWSVVPRIIFSASADEDDVRTTYLLGASAYHVKPADYDGLEAQLHLILRYWTGIEVPPVDEHGRLLVSPRTGHRGSRFPPASGGPLMKRPKPSD